MKHKHDTPRVGDRVLVYAAPNLTIRFAVYEVYVMTGARGLGVRMPRRFGVRQYAPIDFAKAVRGVDWCRGWRGTEADAFRAAHALDDDDSGRDELPPGWWASTYSFQLC